MKRWIRVEINVITLQIPVWFIWIFLFLVVINLIQISILILIHYKNTSLQMKILKQIKFMNFLRDKK